MMQRSGFFSRFHLLIWEYFVEEKLRETLTRNLVDISSSSWDGRQLDWIEMWQGSFWFPLIDIDLWRFVKKWQWESFAISFLAFDNLDPRLDNVLGKNNQNRRSLEEIMKCTRFTKAEIRLLYRSFKQVRFVCKFDMSTASFSRCSLGMSGWKCQWGTSSRNLFTIFSTRQ